MNTLLPKSIPELEKEMLYCLSKADFIADFLIPENKDFRVTVTLGLRDHIYTTFQVSDLYDVGMEKAMLGALEELFRMKSRQLGEILRTDRIKQAKLITGGYNG